MTTYRFRKSTYSALEAWHKLTKKLGFRPKKGQVSSRHTPGFWVWATTLKPKKGKARAANKAPARLPNLTSREETKLSQIRKRFTQLINKITEPGLSTTEEREFRKLHKQIDRLLKKQSKDVAERMGVTMLKTREEAAKIGRSYINSNRSRAKYKTSRSAWNSIAKATGLKPSQVKPAHTKTSWRWEKNPSELLLINKGKKNMGELLLINKGKKNAKPKANGHMTIEIEGKFPGRAQEIRYKRTGKLSGPYYHKFKKPPQIYALKGGGLLLK